MQLNCWILTIPRLLSEVRLQGILQGTLLIWYRVISNVATPSSGAKLFVPHLQPLILSPHDLEPTYREQWIGSGFFLERRKKRC